MDIEGGSIDLSKMRATNDMVMKNDSKTNVMIIETGCAPSQRLKDDASDKFYNLRIVIEVDNEQKFSSPPIYYKQLS